MTTEDTSTTDATQDVAAEHSAEQTSITPTPPAPGAPTEPPAEQPPSFDAAYVAKIRAEAAKYRNEAKANADAARKLAEIEDAQKTETQRLNDARTKAEAEAAAARAEALRWKIAARHGISDDEAELFLTGGDEETLVRQAEVLAAKNRTATAAAPAAPTPTPPAAPAPAPAPRADLSQGARGAKSNDPRAVFAGFLGDQLQR